MKKTGRLAMIVAMAAAAAGMATATPASAAGQERAAKDGPRPLVNAVKAVKAGKPTWVKLYWLTERDICGARVTVSGSDVDVRYPSNTGTYTSFSKADTLAPGWADFTAFRVNADSAQTRTVKLKVRISYTRLPKHTLWPGVDHDDASCKGPEHTRTSWVKLPVLARPAA